MNSATGRQGEAAAVRYLAMNSYTVLSRNVSCRYGELDIVAANADYLVFVEVKTRTANAMVSGAQSVTVHKQKRLVAAAQIYLQQNETALQPRFDVIEIEHINGRYQVVNHIENAF